MIDLNNPEYDAPWVPNYRWKHALLLYLSRRFNLRTFIETGTHWGGTLLAMQQSRAFDKLYSIELSKEWYEKATPRFKHMKDVERLCGNSAIELPRLLSRIPNESTLFWLDAHYSGGDTALSEDPLAIELKTVFEMRPDALIVVDDMQPGNPDWVIPEWSNRFLCGVQIVQHGSYNIPEKL